MMRFDSLPLHGAVPVRVRGADRLTVTTAISGRSSGVVNIKIVSEEKRMYSKYYVFVTVIFAKEELVISLASCHSILKTKTLMSQSTNQQKQNEAAFCFCWFVNMNKKSARKQIDANYN
ncbi:hypothetical protein O3G_MSEX002506 [Manduca sexta]|uniref:Uncharacterized protein n=1 Tax=Manduca sexta TaxID=7130 RepID=A0A921YPD5_MANSE|nr:hypothetical protein O3G_MSEX002506 [Manduca sexta]